MKRAVVLCVLLLIILSCARKHAKFVVCSQKSDIPDSLFLLKDIAEIDDKLLFKSKNETEFVKMDSVFNHKITYPVLIENHGFRKKYLDDFESSYFISKQKKIGNFQPIILSTFGVDNWCVLLVVLDSDLNPVSHTILKGNYGCALKKTLNNLDFVDNYVYSKIKDNIVFTSKVINYWDSEQELYRDSINYQSEILNNGKIHISKIDSIRIYNK